jgi:hypothetical protein
VQTKCAAGDDDANNNNQRTTAAKPLYPPPAESFGAGRNSNGAGRNNRLARRPRAKQTPKSSRPPAQNSACEPLGVLWLSQKSKSRGQRQYLKANRDLRNRTRIAVDPMDKLFNCPLKVVRAKTARMLYACPSLK